MQQRKFFMLLKATARWRAMDPDAQRAVFDRALTLVFNGYPGLRMTRFRTDAFHGRCSHLIVWELAAGSDQWQYEAAVDALHADPFFGAPLFEILDVIAGVEEDDVDTLQLMAFAA